MNPWGGLHTLRTPTSQFSLFFYEKNDKLLIQERDSNGAGAVVLGEVVRGKNLSWIRYSDFIPTVDRHDPIWVVFGAVFVEDSKQLTLFRGE